MAAVAETTMKMTTNTITSNTTLYTFVADFAGYTLADGFLGDMSAQEYAKIEEDDHSGADAICAMCKQYIADNTVWFSEEECRAWFSDDNGRYVDQPQPFMELIGFTPQAAHDAIMAQAARDARA